ncbi:MAG TPA: Gfo/Idh/MocA family oxidoreductase [Candidatus Brocadiia bacterium]|nr:Gfo/Idh/MocA family oxidoreductase [Candidatus Brocadiia bacterium]
MAVRVAYIAVGNIAGYHLASVKKMPDAEIVGLCDIDKARLEARQKEFGGEAFTNPDQMLKAVKADACYICLPPYAHGPAEMACVKHKVPFFVEKPISVNVKTAKKIAAAVKRTKLMAAVGYMNRYRASVARAKQLLAKDPPAIIYGGWIGGYPGTHPWLFDKKKSGGQLLEQSTHTVDLLRYLCGEAEAVACYAASNKFVSEAKTFKADCASTVAVRMKSGAVANIMSAWVCRAGGGVFLSLFSPNYRIDFSGWNHDVKIYHADGLHVEDIKGETNIFEIEDRAWINAVKAGKLNGVMSDYEDGLKSLILCDAANVSMSTRRPVKVKF